ncbi:hypothetical protein CASFOL_030791 [Castilleja foliolosa]|uniref:Uncharacterized protein n=1 Tax=Castilleja foliolosa TaxID=1961234 RepID=A0ABD3C9B8_9LAMI
MATKGSSGPVTRPVKDIRRESKPAIKVRVVRRFYRGANSSNKSLEIVFHDIEGGRITGVVKNSHLASLDHKIVQGRVYGIRGNNYYVENNTGKYLTTLHKFRIVLHGLTKLVEIPEESFFPDFMFDFRNFITLADPDTIDETQLFDVIGKVNEIHNAQERDFHGRSARLIEIVLEDLSGIQVRCTLWDDYVDQILAFEGNLGSGTPVSSSCNYAGAKFGMVYISNSFDTTQIHTLESIPAIELFKSQITNDNLDRTQSISRGSLTSFRLEYDDLAKGNMTVNPIETIFIVDEPVNFWVCAIVGSIIGDWSYLACTKCNKKLERVGLEYICDVCHKTTKTGVYKYKLQLEVLDQTGNVSLLCWDRESEKLIGRPCQELREEYVEILKANKTELPMSLLKLVDQTVLFKVKVETKQLHKDNAVFMVTRLVTDPDVVSKYTKYTAEIESEADFLTLMLNEEKNFETTSEDEVSTPIKKGVDPKISGERGERVVPPKSLDFDQECVGSTSAKGVRNISMKKKQYMRKFVVQSEEDDEDDDMVQVEEADNAEAKEKSG